MLTEAQPEGALVHIHVNANPAGQLRSEKRLGGQFVLYLTICIIPSHSAWRSTLSENISSANVKSDLTRLHAPQDVHYEVLQILRQQPLDSRLAQGPSGRKVG